MVSTYLHGDQKTKRFSIQYGIKSRSPFRFDGETWAASRLSREEDALIQP